MLRSTVEHSKDHDFGVRMKRLTIAILAGCLLLAACSEDAAAPFSGTRRTPSPVIESSLPTVDGATFDFIAQEDGVLLVYFGFTFCPDVCPTTLADLSFARNELGDESEMVDLAMVTVDPDRDDPESLRAYLESFIPGSTALRTEDEDELRTAANEFGVFYQITELEDGQIDVAHSGTVFVIDDQGKLTASWPFGTPATDMANDLDILLSESETNA